MPFFAALLACFTTVLAWPLCCRPALPGLSRPAPLSLAMVCHMQSIAVQGEEIDVCLSSYQIWRFQGTRRSVLCNRSTLLSAGFSEGVSTALAHRTLRLAQVERRVDEVVLRLCTLTPQMPLGPATLQVSSTASTTIYRIPEGNPRWCFGFAERVS